MDSRDDGGAALLPCPFCGGEAVLEQSAESDKIAPLWWLACCRNAECPGSYGLPSERRSHTITAWNRRANESPWRPISEAKGLPLLTRALCWCVFPAGTQIRMCELTERGWWYMGVIQNVTHWMPLPEPPK